MKVEFCYCNQCKKEVDIDLYIEDDLFYNEHFCSYKCLYIRFREKVKEEIDECGGDLTLLKDSLNLGVDVE